MRPLQGRWNFDAENRGAFSKAGPTNAPVSAALYAPDAITREAMSDVQKALRRPSRHAGGPSAWPVTRKDALVALEAFVGDRLPAFGRHQDAMWSGEETLNHSLLSVAMNLKLLDPPRSSPPPKSPSRGPRGARERRGLRAAGAGLARVHPRDVLARHARDARGEPLRPRPQAPRLVLDRRDPDELHARGHRADAAGPATRTTSSGSW